MIKPDAFAEGHTGKILDMILEAGFAIKAMKTIHLSSAQAGKFYEVHSERPFYNDLCSYMSCGRIVCCCF